MRGVIRFMEIIKLPTKIRKERKLQRTSNLKKNQNSYSKLKDKMVPKELKLAQFRKFYHPVLSTHEKECLLNMGLDPWSIEGLKYVGDCKRYKVPLGEKIPLTILKSNNK